MRRASRGPVHHARRTGRSGTAPERPRGPSVDPVADLRARDGRSGTVPSVKPADQLSRGLWLLREQMEQLVCALEIQQLVLLNNRVRWLPMVSENVEHIVDDIRRSEAERIAISRRVCRDFGLHDDASLSELVRAADEPYATAWRQSRLQLLGLQAELDELSRENRELTRRGASAANEVLRSIAGDLDAHDTYDPHGTTVRLAEPTSRFDRTA